MRGVATSGWRGRSFSLGIADAVTVLAPSGAAADAAATLIANAVDLPGHAAVTRRRACELAPDSDLGARLVTVGVDALAREDVAAALASGLAMAEEYRALGLIEAAALFLAGESRACGELERHTSLAAGTVGTADVEPSSRSIDASRVGPIPDSFIPSRTRLTAPQLSCPIRSGRRLPAPK